MPNCEYRFDRYTVQPAERRLLADGKAISLGPRAFDLLLSLVERAGHLVTRDELMRLVWKDLVVEEGNLHVQVSQIRKTLGSAMIETVQGKGYRLLPLVERIETGDRARVIADRALPTPVTSFVGREKEMADLVKALEETRLLTLTGIGGSGKTRLALKLAELVSPQHPTGLWFVDLVSIRDADRLAQTVADAIGIRPAAGQSLESALQLALSGRSALLVLDNCEHLKAACTRLVGELLERVFDLKVVATSREALDIAGERRFVVRPLSLPGHETVPTSRFAGSDAVQLFVERARSARADIEFSDSNLTMVVEICRRLDGIPLAIELAAATLSVLALPQLKQLLSDRFHLLDGKKNVGSRHRGLADVIEWSYERLDASDQRLIARWSVFAGTWSLPAAVALADDGMTEAALVSRLVQLADRSLIHAQYGPSGDMRYSMLESIREYARMKLAEFGEMDEVRARHFRHYLELAERATDGMASDETRRACVLALDAERDNLVLAHRWCDDAPESHLLGLRLVNAMHGYWVERHFMADMPVTSYDPLEQGRRLTAEALDRCEPKVRSKDRGRALWGLSRLECLAGHFSDAARLVEEALDIARELGDDMVISARLGVLASLQNVLGDRTNARRNAEESRQIAARLHNPYLNASLLRTLSDIAHDEGDLQTSEALAIESAQYARQEGARSACQSMLRVASICAIRGDRNGVVLWLRQALEGDNVARDVRWGTEALQLSAFLAGLERHWVTTIRLGACARHYAIHHKFALRDRFDALSDSQCELARQALDLAAYDSAMQAGMQLPLDAAIAEARELVAAVGD